MCPHLGLQLFQLQVAKADGPALLSCLVLEGGSMRLMLLNLTSQNGILSLQCIALQGRMDFNPLAELRTARSRAHGGPCALYSHMHTDTCIIVLMCVGLVENSRAGAVRCLEPQRTVMAQNVEYKSVKHNARPCVVRRLLRCIVGAAD